MQFSNAKNQTIIQMFLFLSSFSPQWICIMTNCCKPVPNHAYKIICHCCKEVYHMKCISLLSVELEHMFDNLQNWLCPPCIEDLFPFNHIEDDDEFAYLCHNGISNIIKISDLIYNPFDSNASNSINCSEFDPDLNFFCEQNLFSGHCCPYFLEETFNEQIKCFGGRDTQFFSVCHINIRSMKANLKDFINYTDTLHIDFQIIGVTETWLNDITCKLYDMENYEILEQHRPSKTGGGVAIFLKNCINFVRRNDIEIFNEYCESIFVEIEKSVFGTEKNIVIGVIYRPPNSDLVTFTDTMKNIVEIIRQEYKICYLMGDYNINLLNVDSHQLTSDFNDTLFSNGFVPLITRPTRVTSNSATLIDNIFTNQLNNNSINHVMSGILLTDISDHYPIFHIKKCGKLRRDVEININRRNYSYRNKVKFQESIASIDWTSVYSNLDTQSAFSSFHRRLVDIHDKCFPLQKITTLYNTRKPWLTSSLRDAIRKKNKLYYKSIKINCLRLVNEYKLYRNTLKRLLKAAEKIFYCDLILQYKGDSKKIWSIIKTTINKNKKWNLKSNLN